jgi:hypothetical protein
MTPVFCCGFECGQLGSAGQHFSSATGFSIDITTKRSGNRSLKALNVNSGIFISANYTSTNPTIVVARAYVFFAVLPNVSVHLLQFPTDASGLPSTYFNSADNKIYARCGTQNGATGFTVTTGQWYLIDMKGDVSGSPKKCDVSVDGTVLGQASTAVSANLFSNLRINNPTGNSTAEIYYDDILISETSADYPIGAGKVEHFIPTSDGTHNVAGANDFERSATGTDITNATTDAYQLIDDVPLKSGTATEYINLIAPPNATDYVEVVIGPAPGINTPTAAPRAVEAIVAVSAAATTGNNLRIALNDNGTTDDIRNATVGSTTIIYSRKHYADPPSAATAWTLSGNGNFNNVRMRCYTSDAAPDPWWASAMIEAEFEEVVTSIPNKIVNINQAVKRAAYY